MMTANGGRQFTPGDLEDMQYTHAVMKESLRLHPSIYYVLRQASKDDTIPPVRSSRQRGTRDQGDIFSMSIASYNR